MIILLSINESGRHFEYDRIFFLGFVGLRNRALMLRNNKAVFFAHVLIFLLEPLIILLTLVIKSADSLPLSLNCVHGPFLQNCRALLNQRLKLNIKDVAALCHKVLVSIERRLPSTPFKSGRGAFTYTEGGNLGAFFGRVINISGLSFLRLDLLGGEKVVDLLGAVVLEEHLEVARVVFELGV